MLSNGYGYRHALGSDDGGASLYYYGADNWAGSGYAPVTVTANQWYTLRAEVDGTQIRLFVDGRLMVSGSGTHATRGTASFEAGPGTDVCVDDLVVRSLDRSVQSMATTERATMTASVRVRTGAGTSNSAISTTDNGEEVYVLDWHPSRNWALIRRDTANGIQGWVAAEYLQRIR
jgi:hypothetical protein